MIKETNFYLAVLYVPLSQPACLVPACEITNVYKGSFFIGREFFPDEEQLDL